MDLVKRIDRRFYPDFENYWDDALFRKVVLTLLRSHMDVLDMGAGAGIVAHMNFRGLAKKVCGVDPDIRVTKNPYLDEGKQGLGEAIPYSDERFDLVLADNVFEQLESPLPVFKEVTRVLRPAGLFLSKTPNHCHYMPLIARMTPFWFHRWVNQKRGRKEIDTFPTVYRANSATALQHLATSAGLAVESIRLTEGRPEYLRFSAVAYVFGLAYERLANISQA